MQNLNGSQNVSRDLRLRQMELSKGDTDEHKAEVLSHVRIPSYISLYGSRINRQS